jgi:hypothetical protein
MTGKQNPPLDFEVLNATQDDAESLDIISGMTGRPVSEVAPVVQTLWNRGFIAPDPKYADLDADEPIGRLWFRITKQGQEFFDASADDYLWE